MIIWFVLQKNVSWEKMVLVIPSDLHLSSRVVAMLPFRLLIRNLHLGCKLACPSLSETGCWAGEPPAADTFSCSDMGRYLQPKFPAADSPSPWAGSNNSRPDLARGS